MARITALTLILLSVVSTVASESLSLLSPSPPPSPPSVFDILPKFGLPSGLLPDSVTSYHFGDDGRFSVELEGPCYVEFDYLVYYEKTITGKLSYGSITELEGLQVRRFLIWFDVNEIRVDLPPSESIYFQVGFINKKLDLDQFKVVRTCYYGHSGCGLRSFKPSLQLPTPVEELQMLLTE